jgi:hypothetical protein
MKKLLPITALVITLGFPTVTLGQTTQAGANATAPRQNTEVQGFVTNRNTSDLFASELMGHDVYARRTPADRNRTTGQAPTGQAPTGQAPTGQAPTGQTPTGQASTNADATQHMAKINRADLEGMDNIGQINEIVLSRNGQIRAIVIGVGGFLGMGERDVAVKMDQVTFASDPENRSEIYIVVNTGAEMLKNSPAYDRTARADERTQRSAFAAPQMTREGYERVAVTDLSSDMLVGKTVYGVNDDSVGVIDDLILDEKGSITNVIIDFGGFLGIGASQVSVGFDELTVLSNAGRTDVRIYVDATKEQIQAQPKYRSTK